ncbi:MAG: hypothetical protein HUU60_01500 [Armatimonadetes bacterium]|nr:hypothetical protein [Armatimonadota bacterium]
MREGAESQPNPVRIRAVLPAFFTIPVCAYWSADSVVDIMFSLTIPPVALLMVVAFLNAIWSRLRGQGFYTSADLAIYFSIIFVGNSLACEWQYAIAPLWHSFGFFQDRNEVYRLKILPYVSERLYFKTPSGLESYTVGGYDLLFALSQMGKWLPIMLAWTALLCTTAFGMLCANSLMRRLWTQRERLAFPILQAPLLLCQPKSPLWKSKYLWIAFGVMVFIDVNNAVSYFYPSIPALNVRFLARGEEYLTSPPWNQVGWIPIGIFPFLSAIAVFVPNDLLFSCILFYFVRKFMQVGAAAMGYEQGVFGGGGLVPSAPYFSEQSWGAFIGLFVTMVYASRGYLAEIWREIKSGQNPEPSAISSRWAFFGFVASLVGVIAFGTAVGLPWWLVTVYTSLYFAFVVVVTRLRAQLGAPIHEMAFMGPHQLMVSFAGTQNLSEGNIVRLMTTFHYMNRIHRTLPSPFQLEAMKLGEIARVSQRWLFILLALAMIVGSLCGEFAYVNRGYRYGAGDLGGSMASVVTQLTQQRYPPNLTGMAFFAGAFSFVLLLDFIRLRFPGFPIHPAGYALSMNFGIDYIWFGSLIVLMIKLFVNRYQGLAGYEKLRAIALGVILGEFAVELPLAWYHIITGKACYTISINGHLRWDE